MKKITFFLIVLFLSTTAHAAPNYGPCNKAFKDYCIKVDPKDRFASLQCLSINKRRETPACVAFVEKSKKADKQKKARESDSVPECRAEERRFCGNVKPGGVTNRMRSCLRLNKDKLSGRCKDALKDKSFFY